MFHPMLGVCLAALFLVGCSSSSPDPGPSGGNGNPDGYMVHCLTGDSLSAKTVTINGISLDTSSAAAIDASVQAIRDSNFALKTVQETNGLVPDLNIDFTAKAPLVPSTFHGADLQWRSKYFLTNPDWRALVKHIRLDLLRFPGGQERVRYDPSLATGTPDQDTLTVSPSQPYELRITGEDMANYIQLCKDFGINAEPEVNLTISDPNMWKQMAAQIVENLGYDLKYISAGNEPDIDSPNGNWPYLGATRGDLSTRPIALATYTQNYRDCQAALSTVKSDLTFALGELGSYDDAQLGPVPYLDPILASLDGQAPGAVSLHWYMLGYWHGEPSTFSGYPSLEHLVVQGNDHCNIGYLANLVDALRTKTASQGLPSKLFLGEWGPSWSWSEVDALIVESLAAAIFNAEAQEFGKTLGLDSMEWFSLSDPAAYSPFSPSLIAVDDAGKVSIRPQYCVYLMYKYLYGNQIVSVPGGQNADWSIYASSDVSKNYLMLINRTESAEFTKVVEVKTAAGVKQLELILHPHSIAIVGF